MKSRFDWNVLTALQGAAKNILNNPELMEAAGAERRDWEILANARICDDCGFIWEASTYIDGCPNCKATKSALEDKFEDLTKMTEEAEDSLDDAENALDRLRDALSEMKSALKALNNSK